ncbi:hypothetical protein ACTUSZ_03040 [Pantoea eucalypti]|uniref:hypothetical protein n=1 Tax=Pantoea eucalypti TaxID=470933 RepID=UPI003FA4A7EF
MNTELKEKLLKKGKVNFQANESAKKRRKKFYEIIPSLSDAFKIAVFVGVVCALGSFINNIYGYQKNTTMIPEHAEICSKNPSYENCSAPIVDASKAGKNAVGIVDGVGKRSLKE